MLTTCPEAYLVIMAECVEIRIPLLQTHEGRRIEVVARADLNGDWTVLESSLTGLASPR